MEWVNITAKTLPEAIDRALDNLGVDEAEADIEVLEEPKQGLFGRLRGNARVRARVKPKATRPKVERGRGRKRSESRGRSGGGDRPRGGNKSKPRSEEGRSDEDGRSGGGERSAAKKSGGNRGRNDGRRNDGRGNDGRGSGGGGRGGRSKQKQDEAPVEEASMEEVSAHLETFLSGLTDAFGFEGPVSVASDDDEGLIASVEGRHGLMVGPKGRTLDAIQELARVSAQRTTPSSIRIKVDVGGYREMRKEALCKFALEAADDALGDGKERSLEPMSSADRKIVHDALSEVANIETRSAGTDPRRRVVVVPLAGPSDDGDDHGDDDVDEVEEAEAVTENGSDAESNGTDEAADDAEAVGS